MRQPATVLLLSSLLLLPLLLLFAAADCPRPEFPSFTQPPTTGDGENYTYTATGSVTYVPATGSSSSGGCASPKGATWEQKWEWNNALSCLPNTEDKYNRSLIFRNLTVKLTQGTSVRIQNFSLYNKDLSEHPLFSFGDIYIPVRQGEEKEYPVAANRPMNANILATGGPHTVAGALLILDSVSNTEVDVEVTIFFECARIRRYISEKALSNESGGFGSIFAAYILPFLVVAVIMTIAIIRWCRPDLTAAVKNWAGFRELDDESRTRHTKIKDKSGGNTWIDNADKVVTDLQKSKMDKLEARHDDQELQDMNDNGSRISSAVPMAGGGGSSSAAALAAPPVVDAPPSASQNNNNNNREDASSAISGMSGLSNRLNNNNNNNNNDDDF